MFPLRLAPLIAPLMLVVSTVLAGCPPSDPGIEPPLRPLVYTESANSSEAPRITGYEAWADDGDPTRYPGMPEIEHHFYEPSREEAVADADAATQSIERLARAVFDAMADPSGDLAPLFLSPEAYAAVAATSLERANAHLEDANEEAREVAAQFRGEVPSERRPEGMRSLVTIESVRVPEGRLASGERADIPEQAVMVWGVEVLLQLRDTEQVFRLRLPKVLRAPDGSWGLAEAPELGGRLGMYLAMGFHLSPQMLAFEHYPLPYHTGNFWTYQVRTLPRIDTNEEVDHTPDDTLPTIRDEVVSRQDYDGYALVRVRRTYSDDERRDDTTSYLLTPRRVYVCSRDCRRNIERIDWLVSHLSSAVTPILVFPLRPGMGWRRGGRLDSEGDYLAWSTTETADVPAGRFEEAVRITHSARAGREHAYFAQGIGVVLLRIDGASETTFHELVDYRIIP